VLTDVIIQSGAVASELHAHVLKLFAGTSETLAQGIPLVEIRDALLRHGIVTQEQVPVLIQGFVSAKLLSTNHPTQIYEALVYLSTFGIHMWYYFNRVAREKPISDYVILGITFIFIFGSRILIEFIKNEQVDFEKSMTLNMGQWLSIPFVIIGFFFIYKHLFQNTQKA
jgi:prolipoprotein diacylglyceryltransferase